MITEFTGEYRWLSNFVPAEVTFEGWTYPTVEHAYVAAKTLDLLVREDIRNTNSPGQVKRFGRKVVLRPDWEEVKLGIMEDLLRQKFAIPQYKESLVTTAGQIIIEGNWWHDNFWGVCKCGKCYLKRAGQNNLGEMIVKIREELIYE